MTVPPASRSAVSASARAAFLADCPEYAATRALDELRAAEYSRLDESGEIYLDYTGGSLYAESQLRRHFDELRGHVFGNPHSNNPTSQAMTDRVEAARAHVLRYFNASADEYLVAFTPNATGALHEIGEAYPFGPGTRYHLTFDNHNSVNGIREFARAKGADVTYSPLTRPDLRVDRAALSAELARPGRAGGLFAFPAQSNFSGVQHPLEIVEEAQAAGWHVLVDAAAFVPTNRLDLSRRKPEFVVLSFYKMFGYPTGIGALLMRRSMFETLRRPWFAGGTIRIASVQGDSFYRSRDASAFEDGTVDYLNIPAVSYGLSHLESVGVDRIRARIGALTGWLLRALAGMKHDDGRPLIAIHGPTTREGRGATIAFNVMDAGGRAFDIRRVEARANAARLSLRTGCFCNPGAGEMAYGLSAEQIGAFFHDPAGLTFDELRERIRERFGLEVGAIRVSMGIASNFDDVHAFVSFLDEFRNRRSDEAGFTPLPCDVDPSIRDGA